MSPAASNGAVAFAAGQGVRAVLERRRTAACRHPLHGVLGVLCYHEGDEPPSAACPGCGWERPALRFVIEIVPDRVPDAW